MAFSATVFAGASQMVALEVGGSVDVTGLLVVTVLVATVNARMILMARRSSLTWSAPAVARSRPDLRPRGCNC